MKQKVINIYSFSELDENIQGKAIEKLYDINVNYEWWESTYDDAKEIGLKITGFDIDRDNYCKGAFTNDACYTANKILESHGNTCETYKDAEEFLKVRDELINTAPKDENGAFEDETDLDRSLDNLENCFLHTLLEDYRIILSNEYEYLTSKEAILETIEANEYEFDEEGNII